MVESPGEDELCRVVAEWVWAWMKRPQRDDVEHSAPARTLESVTIILKERVAEWPRQWLREGPEQGIKQA